MLEKVTILFLTNKDAKWQMDKVKLMIQSFINTEDIIRCSKSNNYILIETKTHHIRIVGMEQSPRGYRANFIFDLSGFQEAVDTAEGKSTYDYSHARDVVNKQLINNGWETEKESEV
ncbi:hypothetical protein ABEY43_06090 [Priestia megaterium]